MNVSLERVLQGALLLGALLVLVGMAAAAGGTDTVRAALPAQPTTSGQTPQASETPETPTAEPTTPPAGTTTVVAEDPTTAATATSTPTATATTTAPTATATATAASPTATATMAPPTAAPTVASPTAEATAPAEVTPTPVSPNVGNGAESAGSLRSSWMILIGLSLAFASAVLLVSRRNR